MAANKSEFTVSVLMPVFNEEKHIGSTLDQIYMQDFPMDKVEVVLADGGSTDRTREIAETYKSRFGSFKVLDNPKRLSSAGRNVGVHNSSAPYVLILDGHTHLPSKSLLTDMVKFFEETDYRCLCRSQPLTPPDINEFELSIATCRASRLGHNPTSDIFSDYEKEVDPTSSGAMYERSVFEEIGYFDENFDACEDVDFNHRVFLAGIKAMISPKLRVFYYPRSSLRAFWRQMLRYGRGRFRFAWKYKEYSPWQWLAGGGVVGFFLMLGLSPFSETVSAFFRNALAFYLLVVILTSFYLALTRRIMGCLLYGLLIFPLIHFGLGVGFLLSLYDRYVKK